MKITISNNKIILYLEKRNAVNNNNCTTHTKHKKHKTQKRTNGQRRPRSGGASDRWWVMKAAIN